MERFVGLPAKTLTRAKTLSYASYAGYDFRFLNSLYPLLNLDDTPVVRYGKDPSLALTAKGISKTYTKTDMCGPPASFTSFFRNPGYIHDVLLTNLTSSSDYFYSYGSFKVRCWLQVLFNGFKCNKLRTVNSSIFK